MKLPLKLLLALVVLVLLFVVGGPRLLAGLVKTAVSRGGEYALGTETELASADVGLHGVGLQGLRVANPTGFDAPSFLELEEARLEVELASLRSETVVAPLFSLQGVDLYLERNEGQTNYGALLERLRQLGGPGDEAPQEGGSGKSFRIDKVRVSDVTAHLDLLPVGGEHSRVQLQLPVLELDDVGSDGGASIEQLFRQIVEAALQSTLEVGGDKIPAELLTDLRGELDRLQQALDAELQQTREELEEKAKGALDELGDELGEGLDELGDKLGGGLKR